MNDEQIIASYFDFITDTFNEKGLQVPRTREEIADFWRSTLSRVRAEERAGVVDAWQFRFDALLKNYSEDRPVPPAVIRMELEAMWKSLSSNHEPHQ